MNRYAAMYNDLQNHFDRLGLEPELVRTFATYAEKECCYAGNSIQFIQEVGDNVPRILTKRFSGVPDWIHVITIDEMLSKNKAIRECFREWLDDNHHELYMDTLGANPFVSGFLNTWTITGGVIDVVGGAVIFIPGGQVPGGVILGVGTTILGKGLYESGQNIEYWNTKVTLQTTYDFLESSSSLEIFKSQLELHPGFIKKAGDYFPDEWKPVPEEDPNRQ